MRQVDHFVVGGAGGGSGRKHQVWNPSTGEVQAEVALGDAALLDRAVAAARDVQPGWAMTNPQKRARVMFRFKELIEANMQDLAEMLSSEHGKVVDDAKGDVQRGLVAQLEEARLCLARRQEREVVEERMIQVFEARLRASS